MNWQTELTPLKVPSFPELGTEVSRHQLTTMELRQFHAPQAESPEGFIQASSEPLLVTIDTVGLKTTLADIYGTTRVTPSLPPVPDNLKTGIVLGTLRRQAKYSTAEDPIVFAGSLNSLQQLSPDQLKRIKNVILATEDARTAAGLFLVQLAAEGHELTTKPWDKTQTRQEPHGEPFSDTTGCWFSFYSKDGTEYIQNGDESLGLIIIEQDNKKYIIYNRERCPAFEGEIASIPPGGQVEDGDIKLKNRAATEIQQELGIQVNPKKSQEIGTIYTWPERQTAASHLAVFSEVLSYDAPKIGGDEQTEVGFEKITVKEFITKICQGEVNDARFIAMFAKTYNRGLV